MKKSKLQKNQIIFHSSVPGDKEEIMRISQEGFFYKGEKVEDVHNVYERFNDWLKGAERSYENSQKTLIVK